MLRLPILSPTLATGAISLRPSYGLVARQQKIALLQRRCYANDRTPKNVNAKATIANPIPGGASQAAPPLLPKLTPSTAAPGVSVPPTSKTEATQVPLTPPPAPGPPWPTVPYIRKELAAGDSAPPPSSASREPVVPKKKHRLRNALLLFTTLTSLSFAGGVYYSLKSDNFHDFFTEYIPFGEEAVLYFEDREFRKRFPNALARIGPKREHVKITIPQRSGATWKIYEPEDTSPNTSDLGTVGPHIKSTGLPPPEPKPMEGEKAQTKVVSNEPIKPTIIDEKPIPASSGPEKVEAAQKIASERAPEKPAPAPIKRIAPLEVSQDSDPAIKDLAKIVNSIISLANDPKDASVFDSAVSKAKSELERLNGILFGSKKEAQDMVAQKLHEQELEFAKVAQGILSRVDQEAEQIGRHYQEELERIKENLANTYREKLKTELDRTAQVSEQRTQNELLEQAIELKRRFIKEIKDRVEEERNGRLGKLKELAETIKELEAVTSKWADVVENNFKTQQLHVAVEAVRNVVEDPLQPRPFIRELAALKEVAENDEVVRAAIASINPKAYQRGVSSHAQLTDRFRNVRGEVRKAALLPEDAGVAGHAASWLLSKMLFKKSGLAIGEDVESILTRTETLLEEGDLDNAAREMNQLTGWAKALARDWLREARLLLEVKQAIDVIGVQARLQALKST
ncbi:mitochondrial inner membrane protein-domain-containing protein [Tirmania nivea]|nr:mitochondrial inner membrane protein-domain-containing protein [Tirmania nivea]